MDRNRFYFKQFSVAHTRSSIKVGVDGVMVGLWADPPLSGRILDLGTGCGVIALILAQRTSENEGEEIMIDAIDIDSPSIEEAAANFADSPWNGRLEAFHCSLSDWKPGECGLYDLIVSNPPFFRSGVAETSSPRLAARHQESLPLNVLIRESARLLRKSGRLALIMPYEFKEEICRLADEAGLSPTRLCKMRGHAKAPWKRLLAEFRKGERPPCLGQLPEEECLTLETSPGSPTEEYRQLGHDFYLKF